MFRKLVVAALVLALGGVAYGASVTIGSNAFVHAGVVSTCGGSGFTAGDQQIVQMDNTGALCVMKNLLVNLVPSATPADPLTTVISSAIENGHVLKASAGRLQDVYVVNTDTVTNYLNIANFTSIPGDGAGFSTECVPVPPGGAVSITYGLGLAESFSTGITAMLSSTACGVITKVAKGFFHGRVL